MSRMEDAPAFKLLRFAYHCLILVLFASVLSDRLRRSCSHAAARFARRNTEGPATLRWGHFERSAAYLKHAGIAQNLNHKLPLSADVDSSGTPVSLGKYFDKRPVVMAEVYFSCGMLCPQVMHGAAMH